MKRVLVTGASGFIGRQTLAPLVRHGFEVHAVARHASGATMDGVVWHEADLLGPATAETLVVTVRPTHLLHLAWISEHGRYWQCPENLDWGVALPTAWWPTHMALSLGDRRLPTESRSKEVKRHGKAC